MAMASDETRDIDDTDDSHAADRRRLLRCTWICHRIYARQHTFLTSTRTEHIDMDIGRVGVDVVEAVDMLHLCMDVVCHVMRWRMHDCLQCDCVFQWWLVHCIDGCIGCVVASDAMRRMHRKRRCIAWAWHCMALVH